MNNGLPNTQEVKKQLEVLLVNFFRECYKDFPKGNITPTESPDFVVKMKGANTLGIELTRLNPANALPNSAEIKEEIEFRDGLIDEMKELFESGSDMKLFAKFLFSEKTAITPQRELAVKARTVSLIRESIKSRNKDSFFFQTLNKTVLPEGLKQVLFVHHPTLESSVWERSNNLGVSNDVVDDIRRAIHKKDEKMRLYKKQHLDAYWLLITTDRLRGIKSFNLVNKVLNEHFESRFQHVFLFDLIRGKAFVLV